MLLLRHFGKVSKKTRHENDTSARALDIKRLLATHHVPQPVRFVVALNLDLDGRRVDPVHKQTEFLGAQLA